VDIYSLGVVVFELWHPFTTGMERAALLRELREGGRLPAAWAEANPKAADLVRCARAAGASLSPSASLCRS